VWLFLPVILIIEGMVGFVVFTVDTAVAEPTRLRGRIFAAAAWPLTLVSWFSNHAEQANRLLRLAMNTWFLVTFGWLIDFEYNHLNGSGWLPVVAWATPAFVVYCIDGMAVSLYKKPVRRALRALLWFKSFAEYLCDVDSIRITRASILVWIMLTLCWLVALVVIRLGPS
jgi:hypothetical protein